MSVQAWKLPFVSTSLCYPEVQIHDYSPRFLKKVAVYTLYECTGLEVPCRLHDSLLSSVFILTWSLSTTNLKTFYELFSLTT